jgi:hypothetical protein
MGKVLGTGYCTLATHITKKQATTNRPHKRGQSHLFNDSEQP